MTRVNNRGNSGALGVAGRFLFMGCGSLHSRACAAAFVVAAALIPVGACGPIDPCDLLPELCGPTAEAGADKEVTVGERVILMGRGDDPNGDSITCVWEQMRGPNIWGEAQRTCEVAFVPAEEGSYEFALRVSDGRHTDTDTVRVTVTDDGNHAGCPLFVDAGFDQIVNEAFSTCLTGANAFAQDGAVLRFEWVQVDGPRVYQGSNPFVAEYCIATLDVCGDQDLTFEMTAIVVNDESCRASDEVVITVRDLDEECCKGDTDCDDGEFCNGNELCEDHGCVSGDEPCAADQVCDEDVDECIDDPCAAVECDDSAFCNGTEACIDGVCLPGEPPCTEDEACDEGEDRCVEVDPCSGILCDDQDACTTNSCVDGVCVFAPIECEDNEICNSETGACEVICTEDEECEDEFFCNGAETCTDGVCIAGEDPCPDGQTCDEDADHCIDLCGLPFRFTSEALTTGGGCGFDVHIENLNGDNHLDLVILNGAAPGGANMAVMLGVDGGTFSPAVTYPIAREPTRLQTGDLNGDGALDAVVLHDYNHLSIMLGDGAGEFSDPIIVDIEGTAHGNYTSACWATGLAVADLDNDGNPDLAVPLWRDGRVAILSGNGNATFTVPRFINVGYAPHAVLAVDLDSDDILDLAVSDGPSREIAILLGIGDGTFFNQQTTLVGGGRPMIGAGDFDADGSIDLATTGSTESVTVLFGAGDGDFPVTATVPGGGEGIVIVDLNGDAVDDIVTANPWESQIVVLLSDGSGNFVSTAVPVAGGVGLIDAADLDHDGDIDFVVGGESGTVTLLHNLCDPHVE